MADTNLLKQLENILILYQENQETLTPLVEMAQNIFGEDWMSELPEAFANANIDEATKNLLKDKANHAVHYYGALAAWEEASTYLTDPLSVTAAALEERIPVLEYWLALFGEEGATLVGQVKALHTTLQEKDAGRQAEAAVSETMVETADTQKIPAVETTANEEFSSAAEVSVSTEPETTLEHMTYPVAEDEIVEASALNQMDAEKIVPQTVLESETSIIEPIVDEALETTLTNAEKIAPAESEVQTEEEISDALEETALNEVTSQTNEIENIPTPLEKTQELVDVENNVSIVPEEEEAAPSLVATDMSVNAIPEEVPSKMANVTEDMPLSEEQAVETQVTDQVSTVKIPEEADEESTAEKASEEATFEKIPQEEASEETPRPEMTAEEISLDEVDKSETPSSTEEMETVETQATEVEAETTEPQATETESSLESTEPEVTTVETQVQTTTETIASEIKAAAAELEKSESPAPKPLPKTTIPNAVPTEKSEPTEPVEKEMEKLAGWKDLSTHETSLEDLVDMSVPVIDRPQGKSVFLDSLDAQRPLSQNWDIAGFLRQKRLYDDANNWLSAWCVRMDTNEKTSYPHYGFIVDLMYDLKDKIQNVLENQLLEEIVEMEVPGGRIGMERLQSSLDKEMEDLPEDFKHSTAEKIALNAREILGKMDTSEEKEFIGPAPDGFELMDDPYATSTEQILNDFEKTEEDAQNQIDKLNVIDDNLNKHHKKKG